MANGVLCLGPGLLTTAAWILSIFPTVSCRFFTRSDAPVFQLGLWSLENIFEECRLYPDGTSFSTKFNSARAFSICTTVIGFFVMLVLWFAACLPFPPMMFKCMSICLIINTLFQGLTFLVWRTDFCTAEGVSCELARDSKCSIAAACLWFVSALLCCCAGKSQDDSDEEPVREEKSEPQAKEEAAEKTDEEIEENA